MYLPQFCEILDEVTDNASYGWNPHLEDQVAWCVWSAPLDVQVAFRFHLLAEWLMHWDMNKEAEMALKKALHCGCHLLGSHDMNSIQTLVLISSVLWRQNRMEEALVVLQLAGEAFAKIDAKGSQCDAVRCFVKVAATYDALGWQKLAQDAWNRVSASI